MKRVFPYLKPYLLLCLLAQLAMIGEVTMDLMQPSLMSRIVDDGVLGLHNNGVGHPVRGAQHYRKPKIRQRRAEKLLPPGHGPEL